MLPMICDSCASNRMTTPEYNGVFHGKTYDSECPVCGGKGRPVVLIHLAVPCEVNEAHPMLIGGKEILGTSNPPKKILCGFGPRLPAYLTASPNAATCYQCLKVYRHSVSEPVESESL